MCDATMHRQPCGVIGTVSVRRVVWCDACRVVWQMRVTCCDEGTVVMYGSDARWLYVDARCDVRWLCVDARWSCTVAGRGCTVVMYGGCVWMRGGDVRWLDWTHGPTKRESKLMYEALNYGKPRPRKS